MISIKHTEEKNIKQQSLMSSAALITSILLLIAAFVFSARTIDKLTKNILPLVDECIFFAQSDDLVSVNEKAQSIQALLNENAEILKIYISHRDLSELMAASSTLETLKDKGEIDDYIQQLNEIKRQIELLDQSRKLTLGNIL